MKHDNSKLRRTLDSHASQRRRLLGWSAGAVLSSAPAVLSLLSSSAALAKSSDTGAKVPMTEAKKATPAQGLVAEMQSLTTRRLHLVNDHTGDNYDLIYYSHGFFLNEKLSKLNHLMRDRRENVATQMDITLYDQLFMLRKVLGTNEPIHILSGYRTPQTNEKLRRRSKRVAKYSLHMEGRAADIYIPGFPTAKLQEAALSLQAGGVGLYSNRNFIHIDTGVVRHWGS